MYTLKFSHIQQISLVNLIKIPFNLNIILYHSKFTLISDYNSADVLHSHDISYLITNMYFLWIVCTFYGIVLIYAIISGRFLFVNM